MAKLGSHRKIAPLSMLAISLSDSQRRIAGNVVEAVARAGYAARGFVYLSLGLMAFAAARELRAVPADARAALQPVADAPFGALWLALVAAGLLGFAFWRGLQAVFDVDRRGRSPKALVQRIGQGISGLGYSLTALSIFTLLDHLEDLTEADDQAETTAFSAWLAGLPFGQALLLAAGAAVIVVGLLNIAHALDRRFQSALDCSKAFRRWAGGVGRAGYFARGVAFGTMGVSLIRAGLTVESTQVTGLGGALEALKTQHGGPLLLALIALGLVAFGLFGLFEARYRRLLPPPLRQAV